MKQDKWGLWQYAVHWLIHRLDDCLIASHDTLIEWACERNLWQTPGQRAEERPPDLE